MTAEEIRSAFQQWREKFESALKGEISQGNAALKSVDFVQAFFLSEIAAQLAEMNEWARTADDPTMDKEFSDIATKVKKWRGTSE